MDRYHGEHEPIRLRKPSPRQRIGFLISTLLAIAVVFGGWYATVFQQIRGNVGETKSQISNGLSAAAQIREETQASREDASEALGDMKSLLDPFVRSVEQQDAAMSAIAEEFIQQQTMEPSPIQPEPEVEDLSQSSPE